MLGPVITGERVRLVPPTAEMLETFCRWFADTEVTRFLDNIFPYSLDSETDWFKNVAKSDSEIIWAVLATDGDSDRLIGTTGIGGIRQINRAASSGNLIGEKSEWGKGYGSEVVRLRTRFAFEEMNLHKISTQVETRNIGSRRVLEKAGYREIGIAREQVFRNGAYRDMWLAEILQSDWRAANPG